MESFQASSALQELRDADVPTLVVHPEVHGEPQVIVLLSGSFDPITVAHLAVADAAAATENAELVLLVYSARTLPKDPGAPEPLLDEEGRLESIRRLAVHRPRYAMGLCSHGLLAEQVAAVAARFPRARIAVAMGSDKLLQVLDPSWYEDRDAVLRGMFVHAELRYALRTGDDGAVEEALAHPSNAAFVARIRALAVPRDVADVSSRMIRELVANGEDPSDLVPEAIRSLLPQRGSGGS
ncbi:MAG: hypothetical protein ABR600_14105 [Actinomycetota bacterium]